MTQTIGYFTLLCATTDAAIAWFTGVLGFETARGHDLARQALGARDATGSGGTRRACCWRRAVGDAQIARIGARPAAGSATSCTARLRTATSPP